MTDSNMKEVYFDQYCKICKHSETAESENPCNECLNEGAIQNSHRPRYYEVGVK